MNAGTNGNNGFASSTSSSDNETNGVNGEHKKEKKKMNKRDQERIPNKRLSRIFSQPVFSLLSFILNVFVRKLNVGETFEFFFFYKNSKDIKNGPL